MPLEVRDLYRALWRRASDIRLPTGQKRDVRLRLRMRTPWTRDRERIVGLRRMWLGTRRCRYGIGWLCAVSSLSSTVRSATISSAVKSRSMDVPLRSSKPFIAGDRESGAILFRLGRENATLTIRIYTTLSRWLHHIHTRQNQDLRA